MKYLRFFLGEIKKIFRLSFSLAKVNFKLRNEGSYLGIFWYLLEPLLLFIILIFLQPFFSNRSIISYPAYLLLGLVMFNFFSQTTTFSITSIENNKRFMKSIKIPPESIIIANFFQNIFSHFFEMVVVIVIFILFKYPLVYLLYYPLIFIFLGIFTIGASLVLASAGVYIIDLVNVWRVVVRILWFVTPIFYAVNESYSKFFLFNPLYYFISIARSLIIYNKFPGFFIIFMAVFFSVIALIFGIVVFEKYKNKFAELI